MALGNIDIKKLRAFQLTANHGSLRRAAVDLLLTPAAVSIQIKRLEEQLGVELFQRVGKRLLLSPSGELFLREVDAALNGVEAAIALITKKGPSLGRVSVSIGNDLAGFFSGAIAKFMKSHPEVEVSLRVRVSPQTLALVMDGDVDLGVGYFGTVPPEISKNLIQQSGFSLLVNAAHPLARLRTVGLEELSKHRLITLPAESNMGRRIAQAFSSAGIEPVSIIEAAIATPRGNSRRKASARRSRTHPACLSACPNRSAVSMSAAIWGWSMWRSSIAAHAACRRRSRNSSRHWERQE